MVNFYVKRINDGKMTVEQVPLRWRKAVQNVIGKKDLSDLSGQSL